MTQLLHPVLVDNAKIRVTDCILHPDSAAMGNLHCTAVSHVDSQAQSNAQTLIQVLPGNLLFQYLM